MELNTYDIITIRHLRPCCPPSEKSGGNALAIPRDMQMRETVIPLSVRFRIELK